MFRHLRTSIIQKLIGINERIVFYPELKRVYKSLFNSNTLITIIDIGSNKGQSIDFFRSISSNTKIYGFEPNPTLFRSLEKKYKNCTNVHLSNQGVSNINGKLIFQENLLNETSTFEELNYESTYLKQKSKILGVKPEAIIVKKYEVEVCRISDFIAKNNLQNIDIIKIDVEGHELQCLKGLFESNDTLTIKYIQLESHSDDMYINKGNHVEINEILKSNGFNEFKKIKHGFGDFHEILYKNVNIK